MSDKKPDLKVVNNKKKDKPLTLKQRAFVEAIVRGKLDSQIDCYMQVYNVARTKTGAIPKHAHVDCSRLMSNPSVSLAIKKGIARKELTLTASSARTRTYVLERLLKESREADSDSARIRAIELLGKTVAMFTDATTEHPSNRSPQEIEQDIEAKLEQLLASNE